jgi:hypothetical protein
MKKGEIEEGFMEGVRGYAEGAGPSHEPDPQATPPLQMKRYTQNLLSRVSDINAEHPWSSKEEVLFGRFSQYKRIIHTGIEEVQRVGVG